MKDIRALQTVELKAIELPEFKEIRGKDWISFGSQNKFPQLLIDLYQSSSIHHTCVNAKIDAMTGEGFLAYGDTVINTQGQTLNDLLDMIAQDFILFGSYSLNLIWNRAGDRIAEIYHLPVANVRSGKMNEEDVVDTYYYSSNWANTRKYEPKAYPSFSLTNNRGDMASQIYYFHPYTPGSNVYALPEYQGALNDIELDKRISRFHNANISAGMYPGLFITLTNGNATSDERQMIYRDLERAFSGEQNAGKLFLSFVDSPDRKPVIETIDQVNDDYYIILSNRVRESITTAHRITSTRLIGINDASGFSNNADEIEVAYAHFLSTVIEPLQKQLVKSLDRIIRGFGMNVKLEIVPSKLDVRGTVTTTPNS